MAMVSPSRFPAWHGIQHPEFLQQLFLCENYLEGSASTPHSPKNMVHVISIETRVVWAAKTAVKLRPLYGRVPVWSGVFMYFTLIFRFSR